MEMRSYYPPQVIHFKKFEPSVALRHHLSCQRSRWDAPRSAGGGRLLRNYFLWIVALLLLMVCVSMARNLKIRPKRALIHSIYRDPRPYKRGYLPPSTGAKSHEQLRRAHEIHSSENSWEKILKLEVSNHSQMNEWRLDQLTRSRTIANRVTLIFELLFFCCVLFLL